jgi:hypothetical protein
MPHFRSIPMPAETAARWRETGVDDFGQALIPRVVEDAPGGTGYPCRQSLRYGEPGEVMLLGSFRLPRPLGVYWTPSPVFIRAEPCETFCTPDVIPPTATGPDSLLSVRAYDADDLCLYDLGQVARGPEIETPLMRALADPRTKFVNIHTARPGCWIAGVERVAGS